MIKNTGKFLIEVCCLAFISHVLVFFLTLAFSKKGDSLIIL